jgi:hypothetical protein
VRHSMVELRERQCHFTNRTTSLFVTGRKRDYLPGAQPGTISFNATICISPRGRRREGTSRLRSSRVSLEENPPLGVYILDGGGQKQGRQTAWNMDAFAWKVEKQPHSLAFNDYETYDRKQT